MKKIYGKIAADTIRLTIVYFILQGLGLILNISISNRLGAASVGIMTLIFSFFGFVMVLANGNIFISTSRFVSEEIGAGNKNVARIMRYSIRFSLCLSGFFAVISFVTADIISVNILKTPSIALSIRIIALSLPLASIGSCIKGYFHAIRQVKVPCIGDCIEFAVKWLLLVVCVVFFLDKGMNIYLMIAMSICLGEAISCLYFVFMYIGEYNRFSALSESNPNIKKIPAYLKLSLPILISGYVQMIMSSANEALVPYALLKYNDSAEKALSEYGLFEAMIIPVIFFPAVVLSSLSNIIIPEVARENSAKNYTKLKCLISDVFSKSFTYAFFIAGIMFSQGKNIGYLICPYDSLVGNTLVRLCPVIPFIYLEIVLEGILKGIGKQNFSTVNSLCEYIIRILCVIIFVRICGFTGVLISYYASNIYSNIVRIIVVCRTTRLKFSLMDYLVKPFAVCLFCQQLAAVTINLIKPVNLILTVIIYICSSIILYLILQIINIKYFNSRLNYCIDGI